MRNAAAATAVYDIMVMIVLVLAVIMNTPVHALEWTGSSECEAEAISWYTELMGYTAWNEGGANYDGRYSLANITSGFDALKPYMNAAHILAKEHNPLAAAFLPYARSFSLMDQMIDIPTRGNTAQDVVFDLPDADDVGFETVSDLLYMSIRDMASLIAARRVSCVDVVSFFIDATKRVDPHLAIVTVTLYDEALAMAAQLDAEMEASGVTRGPLTCIPFGVKDHHQIFDETVTNGHILNYNNHFTVKSTLVHQAIKHGAIPIAKTTLGAFAFGAVHGWGVCLSPYLNGGGSGSSCGSGSGASAGIFPFALSEETGGSIASPSAASFISGYLSSYGVFSRAGADLRAIEYDHLGFHSRYISDYGIIVNYLRTGVDPLDGDTVAFSFEDPAKIDPSTLKVLVVGDGAKSSFGITGHRWSERYPLIVDALESAGVSVDVKSADECSRMWSWDADHELLPSLLPKTFTHVASKASVWGKQMFDQLSASNAKGDMPRTIGAGNLPAIAVTLAKVRTRTRTPFV